MTTGEQANPVRRHVIYHGRVQGVLFRATSHELSRKHDVVGYVRNLPDGTVELEAEGPAPEVERFLAAIGNQYERYITSAAASELPPHGDESDFRIRY